MSERSRGRFAPSPTGDAHFGTARTALAAWLFARAAGAELVMRIEDLDSARTVAGAEQRILDDLRWLGLDWDGAPVRQSQRLPLYEEALARLQQKGLAFPCTCSRAEVARAAQAPHGPSDDGPRYPGTCRDGPAAGSRAPSMRFRVADGVVAWKDSIVGDRCDDVSATVGDFVLQRADRVFAYQLAVVVDDAAMGVTQVVRGDDLLSSTARQLLLYRALDLPAPTEITHVPLVLGPDGARLSKRHGSIAIADLRARGWTPERLVGLLASTLGLCPAGSERSAQDVLRTFDPARIHKQPTLIDPGAL
jgi:glutamyl-tRNA synthetase